MFFIPRNIGWEHVIVGACAIVLSSVAGAIIINKIFNQSVTNKESEKSEEK